MTSKPALIFIAGGPGAGKTALGRALARRISSAVLLDKDVLCGGWVDAILHRFNDGQVDRDSKLYWDFVRPLEYSALLEAALDNLALGKTVIEVAPFGPELRNPEWLRAVVAEVTRVDAVLKVIWIETDAEAARIRMTARNDARDQWKLTHWDEFAQDAPFAPPRDDILVLRNTGAVMLADLERQAIDYLISP